MDWYDHLGYRIHHFIPECICCCYGDKSDNDGSPFDDDLARCFCRDCICIELNAAYERGKADANGLV